MIYSQTELEDILQNLDTTEEENSNYKKCKYSVTKIRDCFKEPFDAPKQAAYCSKRDFYKEGSKYYQMTPEMIMEEWTKAADAGKAGGRCLDDYIGCLFENASPEKTLEVFESAADNIKNKLNTVKSYKENDLVQNGLKFMSRERRLSCPEYNVHGRFDILFTKVSADPESSVKAPAVILIDWKNDKEIKTENRYQKLYGPLSEYDACELNLYTIQLYIYKYILRTYYQIENPIVTMLANVQEDKVINYMPAIPYSDELVEKILKFANKILSKNK